MLLDPGTRTVPEIGPATGVKDTEAGLLACEASFWEFTSRIFGRSVEHDRRGEAILPLIVQSVSEARKSQPVA